MIELTTWVWLLLAVGGIVTGVALCIACFAVYSHFADVPLKFKLGPLTVRINDESE
jgi:hypothetical protein